MKPLLTLVFALFCFSLTAQVKFKVRLLTDNVTYQVLVRPDATWAPPMNAVPSAQVSLRVPTGGFTVGAVTNLAGNWTHQGTVVAPSENPVFDYVNFGLQGATSAITFNNGVEVPIFNFINTGACTGSLELVDNNTDPFMPPNSQSVNVGNAITVIGAGFGNAYTGNFNAIAANCLPSSNCGIEVFDIILKSPSACGVADGQIEIVATNSNGLPLQYTINHGNNQTVWQPSPIFPNLASGDIFNIAVRDIAAICQVVVGGFELQGPLAAVVLGADLVQPDCGEANGSITINAVPQQGGVLEYATHPSGPWQSSPTFSGLAEGLYSFWVRDIIKNCSSFAGTYNLSGCAAPDCLITYDLLYLGNGRYQVNMLSDTTWTFPNNITSSMQVTIKVPTGGFVASNVVSQLANADFIVGSIYAAPTEDPAHDYISFILNTPGTQGIPYVKGDVVPLFLFENTGTCTGGDITLMANDDPFYPPNSQSANVGQQLSVSGYGGADAPICLGNGATCGFVPPPPPPPPGCLITYEIEKLPSNLFQVSMIADTTWTFPNNLTSSMQFTVKVPTGGFVAGDLTSLLPSVDFSLGAVNIAPVEDPAHDYISFILNTPGTSNIPYEKGVKTPLFTFKNTGTCQNGQVFLMDNDTDPFYPPNSQNANVGQQLTVIGYGGADAPICISNLPAEDCSNDPCDLLAPGFLAQDACQHTPINFDNTTTSIEPIISWSWDFGDNSAPTTEESPSHTYVSSGNFEVSLTVTTESGCIATFSDFVTVFPSPGTAPVDFFSVCNGVGVSLQSPDNITSASWSPATGLDDPNSLTPFAEPDATTTYTLTATNNFGCTATSTVTVAVSIKPVIKDVVATPQSDCGVQDASIFVSAFGDGPVEFSLDNISWQTDSLFANLAPGDYNIFVRNANGSCTTAYNGNPVTILAPVAPNFVNTATLQPSGCISDGSITINATGGNGPLRYSINGGQSFQASHVFNNLGGGTYHIVIANNNGSCQVSGGTVVLTQPSPPTVLAPVGNFSLCNGTSATVSIEISTNISSYTINGNGVFSGDFTTGNTLWFDVTANGVGTTNFNVQFTDVNNCTVSESFSLTGIAVPTASFNVSPIQCTNGDVSFTFTGNAVPSAALNWSLDGGQLKFSSPQTPNSPAGANIVVSWPTSGPKVVGLIIDNQGCVAAINNGINITDFNPGATLTVTDAACGVTNGAINLNLAGTGTYTFHWSNASNSQNLTNLNGGTYQVTITESGSGCSATASAVVGASQPVFITNLNAVPANSCSGTGGDGSLTVSVGGGTSNYTLNLLQAGNGGSLIGQFSGNQTSYTFTGLAAGAYQVQLLDANGCSDLETTAITSLTSDLAATVTVQNSDCGVNNGSFSVNITGGQAPYKFDIYQNNQLQATNVNVNNLPLVIGNQAPGTSVLIIRDANGCIVPVTATVGSQQANFTISATTNPAGCTSDNGAILLTGLPSGATIQWAAANGLSLGSMNPLENLAAGLYFTTVTDAIGCTKSASFAVTTADGPELTLTSLLDANCGGNSGAIHFEATGGGTFSFNVLGTINSGFGIPGVPVIVSGIGAGSYVIEVTNQTTGCTGYLPFSIGGGTQMFTSTTVSKASACGVVDGFVEIEITGGSGPYTIASDQGTAPADPVSGLAVVENLYEGIVTITITDANGCTITVTANLGEFDEPVLTMDDITVSDYSCPGEFGSILAADSAQVYQIFDQNNSFVAITPWTGATLGTYIVRFTQNGCTATLTDVVVTGPDNWVVGIESGDETCLGNDGFLSLTVGGANGGYSYNWSNGTTGPTANGLSANVAYHVTITDSLGCVKVESGLQVGDACNDVPCNDVFYLDTFRVELLGNLTEICLPTHLPDLSIFDLNLNGAPYLRDIESCIDSTIFYGYGMLLSLGSPPYMLDRWTYRDTETTDFQFDEISQLLNHMNTVDPLGNWLLNEDDKSINGGASNANYGSLVITHINSATTLNLQVNTVSVSRPSIFVNNEPAHIFIVSDPTTGCRDTLYINVLGVPDPQLDTITVTVPLGGTTTFCLPLDELPGTPELITNYCISFTNNVQLISQGDECFEVMGLALGPDKACFIICDDLGKCDTTLVIFSVVDTSKAIFIHNGFSPNGDGVNDFFTVRNIDLYPNNSLNVFNRWGSRVYSAKRYNNTWDAIYRNTKLPDGSYFYILEVEIDGNMERFTGYVQVNR